MQRYSGRLLAFSLVMLFAIEIMRVYWIMPFPGSQRVASLGVAYALHQWVWYLRLLFGIPALWALAHIVRHGSMRKRMGAAVGVGLLGMVTYQTNGPMSAEHMFRQPEVLTFELPDQAKVSPSALVIGVTLVGADGKEQARAYPIRFIGYHHQVRDMLAGQPLLVTYCTVCRTGRVFSPMVDGQPASFRLVGMDHFNALFEDDRTGSWWRQANGQAVAGVKRGEALAELPSQQMTWAAWRAQHPATDVMAPDPAFAIQYAQMDGFEEGARSSLLTGRNPASWEEKSWVVGVLAAGEARAFDWNELVRERVINDRIGDVPVVLILAADGLSFRAFDARIAGTNEVLQLERT